MACFRLSSASQSGFLAGSPETSELSLVSAEPPVGVVAVLTTGTGTGRGSDGLLLPAVFELTTAAEDLVFESSECRRIPLLSPLVEEERLPNASC